MGFTGVRWESCIRASSSACQMRFLSLPWPPALLAPLTRICQQHWTWALPPNREEEESKGCSSCQAVTASLNREEVRPGLHWPGSVSPSTGAPFSSACDPASAPHRPRSASRALWPTRPVSPFSVRTRRGRGPGNATCSAVASPSPPPRGPRGRVRPFPRLGLHLTPADSLESGSRGSEWCCLIMILIKPAALSGDTSPAHQSVCGTTVEWTLRGHRAACLGPEVRPPACGEGWWDRGVCPHPGAAGAPPSFHGGPGHALSRPQLSQVRGPSSRDSSGVGKKTRSDLE